MALLLLALAPGLVIALDVYVRDKYEHEKTATLLGIAANAMLVVGRLPLRRIQRAL